MVEAYDLRLATVASEGVGGVVVQVWQRGDELVWVAGSGHSHLLSRHELEGAVGAEVERDVRTEDLLHVCVEGSEAVVRGRGLGKEELHGIPLVAKGGLHPDEEVPEALSEDEQVLAVCVQLARRGTPVLVELLCVGAERLVL